MSDTQPDSLGHVTRYSDSSLYDEICVNCGAIDRGGQPNLSDPCSGKRCETHQPCPFFGVDCEYVAMVEAQAAEIEKLKAIVRGWHYLAVGPDEMGDYYTQKALIKASEPYADPVLAGKAEQ